MSRKVLHIISQAHLDPVWLWPERDGIAEALTTMQSAVDRAAEFPQFKFTRSSAAVYRWAEEMDPQLFASINELIQAGRWEVVGGMIEQPDCNLPSAESFIRQALYSKRFFNERFGEAGDTKIGYVPDSFGHAAGLPQILEHCDFDAYVFMRPQPENGITLPLLFRWQSPDKSSVLGIRIPIQYSQSYAATPDDVEEIVRASAVKGFVDGFDNGVMWFGVGNHGGGPTREHIQRLVELQDDESLPEIRFSTVREFIEAVQSEEAYKNLPVVDDELQFVFRGCYSATSETKQQHRFSEKQLFAAETLNLQAGLNMQSKLHEPWWQLGYNQFHDILAGTCVYGTQEEIRTSFGSITTAARKLTDQAAFSIIRRVDTSKESGSVLSLVNPLPWERYASIQLDTFTAIHGKDKIIGLKAPDGTVHPVQWTKSDANFGPWGLPWGCMNATLPLPASGHRVFEVVTEEDENAFKNPFGEDGAAVSSEQFIKTGEDDAAEWIDVDALSQLSTPSGVNLLAGAPRFVVLEDPSGSWGHFVDSYDKVVAELEFDSVQQIEDGDILRITRHRAKWDASTILMDVVEHKISKEIELKLRFNWQQERQLLKLVFPTTLPTETVHSLNPASVQARPANGEEQPCHDWVALEGIVDGETRTFAVTNDSTYSYSSKDGELALLLTRGVPHAEHPPFEYKDTTDLPFLDQGWQERRFGLIAGDGTWQAQALSKQANNLQIPAVAMFDSGHKGTLPYEQAGLAIETESVAVLGYKAAEDSSDAILRIQEQAGEATEARGSLSGLPFSCKLEPWEIKTLRMEVKGDAVNVSFVNGLEQ